MEGLAKLHPRDVITIGVHDEVVGPPCTGRALELMGSKESLLVVLTPKESELLLDGAKPMVSVERILSARECGHLSLEKIQEVISACSSTSSLRGRVTYESSKKHRLSLAVFLNLH